MKNERKRLILSFIGLGVILVENFILQQVNIIQLIIN